MVSLVTVVPCLVYIYIYIYIYGLPGNSSALPSIYIYIYMVSLVTVVPCLVYIYIYIYIYIYMVSLVTVVVCLVYIYIYGLPGNSSALPSIYIYIWSPW